MNEYSDQATWYEVKMFDTDKNRWLTVTDADTAVEADGLMAEYAELLGDDITLKVAPVHGLAN